MLTPTDFLQQADNESNQLLLQYYRQLSAINQHIAARPDHNWPTKEENVQIRQITATIRVLKGKSAMVIALETIMRLHDKIKKTVPALLPLLLPQLFKLMLPGINLDDLDLSADSIKSDNLKTTMPVATTPPSQAATAPRPAPLPKVTTSPQPKTMVMPDAEMQSLLATMLANPTDAAIDKCIADAEALLTRRAGKDMITRQSPPPPPAKGATQRPAA